MASNAEAAIDALYLVDGKAEIVAGELVVMSPTGGLHGRIAARIFSSLLAYEARTARGYAFPDNVGFIVNLPNRRSFSPDAAFATQAPTEQFVEGAPAFAVEVRSKDDYGPGAERTMAAKRADYFAAGTLVVWDVDALDQQVIQIYRAGDPENPTILGRGELADAEPALPGWSMPVDDVCRR